jgi:hypothetical protein
MPAPRHITGTSLGQRQLAGVRFHVAVKGHVRATRTIQVRAGSNPYEEELKKTAKYISQRGRGVQFTIVNSYYVAHISLVNCGF